MVNTTFHVALLVLVTLPAEHVEAGTAARVSGIPLTSHASTEAAWTVDARDAESPGCPLLQAALIAGGCRSAATLQQCRTRFDDFCRIRQSKLAGCESDRQRAEILLHEMHAQWLVGTFQAHCYRIDQTLAGGPHNCLTSTILYLCLCRRFGISARAVALPTHLYCRLDVSGMCDVQTTCPDWFERHGNRCQGPGSETPGVSPEAARELDDTHLIARIYYNRGTNLLVQHEYRRAAACLEQSCQLDPLDQGSRHNLIAAWNNWSLQLCDGGRFAESAAVLATCLSVAPNEPSAMANDLHVHHKWIIHLCRQNQFDAALSLLDQCYRRRSDAELYDLGRWSVCRMWAMHQWRQSGAEGAREVFSSARQRYGDGPAIRDCETQFWLERLDLLEREGRVDESARVRRWLQSACPHLTDTHL